MPIFLQKNPIKEWVDLWNRNPAIFWRKYWTEKKLGTLPQNFEHMSKGGKKAKKDALRGRPPKNGRKKEEPKVEAEGEESECSDGHDPRHDKVKKAEARERLDQQYHHDMMISSQQRKNAVVDFMTRTGFDENANDSTTAKALTEMADERKVNEHKKRERKQRAKERAEVRK